MQQSKRRVTTVKLTAKNAKAVKARAALNDQSVADVVNALVSEQLRREAEIIRIARERLAKGGKPIPLAEVLEEAGLGDLLSG